MASELKAVEEAEKVVHVVEFFLKSGQSFTLRVYELETGVTDTGGLGSFKLEAHPDENMSYMFLDPNEVAAIVSRIEN
jgi:hypothetical protein